jgi:hypothetical protein
MDHHKATHFLQDGAPCHKSKKVMEFLKGQKFSLMDWPGNSPDLKPIENLWSIIKCKIKKKENFTSPAHQGHQGDLGDPAQAPDAQAGSLHADQDPEVPGE